MSNEKKLTHSNIDFEIFLNFLKEIESELKIGLLIQETDYKLIDSVALKLVLLDSKIDLVFNCLDSLYIEDKNKYERACIVLNNSINESMEILGYSNDWEPVNSDDDDVYNENDTFWFLVNNQKLINRLNTKKSSLKISECITVYIFKLYSIKEKIKISDKSKNIDTPIINPLSLLKEEIVSLFIAIEKKALCNKPNFSAIRCAAFCDLLYVKKYFKNTNSKIKTLTAFASMRYQLDIKNSLASSKNADRKNHQEKIVGGATPLRKCF